MNENKNVSYVGNGCRTLDTVFTLRFDPDFSRLIGLQPEITVNPMFLWSQIGYKVLSFGRGTCGVESGAIKSRRLSENGEPTWQLLPALRYLPHPCGRAEKPFWPISLLIFVKYE